jgi:endo-1,4-beta-mannosidase
LAHSEPIVSAASSSPASAFVTTSGRGLRVDDEPLRFLGVNRYDLLGSARFSCGARYDEPALERICAEIAACGLRVVRTWAFSSFTDGGRDFAPLDRLIAAARRHALRLVLTLENEWRDCTLPDPGTPDGRKGISWFATGWRETYAPYLEVVGARYRDEPSIAAWQLMNEAECPDAGALHAFAAEASKLLKEVAPRHLVSLGTIGGGQAGTVGTAFRRLHEIPTIDLVEAHDYGEERVAIPAAVAAALDVARALGKPFFIGEAGVAAPPPAFPFTYEERARLLGDKIEATLARGASGYLVWSFYDLSPGPASGWDFAPPDPLAYRLTDLASRLRP